jgi:hypothetical protein
VSVPPLHDDSPNETPSSDWSNVHPDFDGHLEYPLEKMTTTQKLEWLWEMMQFQHWVKTQVRTIDERDSDG